MFGTCEDLDWKWIENKIDQQKLTSIFLCNLHVCQWFRLQLCVFVSVSTCSENHIWTLFCEAWRVKLPKWRVQFHNVWANLKKQQRCVARKGITTRVLKPIICVWGKNHKKSWIKSKFKWAYKCNMLHCTSLMSA